MTDCDTTRWTRNEGDERAAANGCRFDVLRGAWTVYWIERFCKLYEGEGYAGQPLILHGCKQCDHSGLYAVHGWDDPSDAPPKAVLERSEAFEDCVAAGHRIDWQYECFMRLFSWVRHSERWRREVRRFKKSSIWIPKKQGKSPTLAALGLYLLAGDGEPGQKVFLAAKDGEQARMNAGKHAVEMWLQSEELRSECALNKSIVQITHEPSRSIMRPLSSSNSRTILSKEGLNGSVLVDETHVVDRVFVDTISRTGISRSEALWCEFSTAGDNPDGYGKESFDYSAAVLAGTVTDEEHFAAIYAAPQDVTDDQLEKDFNLIADACNPSMGRLIEAKEIRTDYERSKVTIEKLATFKKYRLNVWQHSSNPWLRPSDWAKCRAEYTEEDLLGQRCFGAFDLAHKWDTAAFVLLFPLGEHDPPRFRLWVWFFLPEVSAKINADKAPWHTWDADEHLKLTDGNVTDYPYIRRVINDANKKFDLQTIAYDKKLAEYFAQVLQDEDGLKVVEYSQQPSDFEEPMRLVEEDVIARRVEHPGNPCLDWQAGNATKARNGMLVKPDDHKKIDGIVALVMARAMAAADAGPSVYDKRGIASIGGSAELATVPPQGEPATTWGGNWGDEDD